MSREIRVKNAVIGGGNRILIQSMLNADTLDYDGVIGQLDALKNEGCDIIRLAVENVESVEACRRYLDYTSLPLVADIQFDYRLAIMCSDIGFPKIRFNPGNIGGAERAREVVRACKANKTAIRIGVNGGSLERGLSEKYFLESGGIGVRDAVQSTISDDLSDNAMPSVIDLSNDNSSLHNGAQFDRSLSSREMARARAIVESALNSLSIVEAEGFGDIVLSVKSSDLATTITANRMLNKSCDYPLHIGITESGMGESGILKSAIGIGALLLDGIGDTIRVSLTGDPCDEVRAAKSILDVLGLTDSCRIISCPTCSRCKYDLAGVVAAAQELAKNVKRRLKIAIMGCAVNGPGEAADADFGIAFGKDNAVVFEKGHIVKTINTHEAIAEIKSFINRS